MADKDFSSLNLGTYLAGLRAAKGFTLRQVEDATNKDISNAYLSQLENGKIAKPSAHILHSLSEVYEEPYEKLMQAAGYFQSAAKKADADKHGRVATFATQNLTTDEEEALLKYLRFLRSEKGKN